MIRWSVAADRNPILDFTLATGFFRPNEMDIAVEVLDDALAKGPGGHYQSYTSEIDGRPAGWVCFGPTPCTEGTFDIYWIVVAPDAQGRGIGRELLDHAEQLIAGRGGRMTVAETAGRDSYEPTRQFYLHRGYHEAARVAEFYAPGDDKVIFVKRLGS